jgi:hypothetical protein
VSSYCCVCVLILPYMCPRPVLREVFEAAGGVQVVVELTF